MSSDLAWFEDDDSTPSGTLSFAPTNGVASDAQERHLINDQDASGDDDSEDLLITAMSRNGGTSDPFTFEDELAANGWIEYRLIGSSGTGIQPQTTGWIRLGKGRFSRVKLLPARTIREFEFRINIPVGAGVVAKDVKVRLIEGQRAISLELGHYEGGAQGIVMGLGDGSFTDILHGFEVAPASPEDNTVIVSKGANIHAGVPIASIKETITFNDEDVNTDALASGEEYPVTLSRSSTGATVVTKGAKGTAPVADDAFPDVPDGDRFLCFVRVPYSATITDSEIDQSLLEYGCAKVVSNGLSAFVHPFEMLCGNAVVVSPSKYPITYTDDSDNYVFVLPSGEVQVNTTGAKPDDRAMMIWTATLSSGSVTAETDLREFKYLNPVEVTIRQDGTLSSNVNYSHYPRGCQAYLLPIGGVSVSLGDVGATGQTQWEIEACPPDGSFASIYPSSGDEDNRPLIDESSTDPVDRSSLPETLSFGGWTRFRATVIDVPSTPSTDAVIVLRLSAVGVST